MIITKDTIVTPTIKFEVLNCKGWSGSKASKQL